MQYLHEFVVTKEYIGTCIYKQLKERMQTLSLENQIFFLLKMPKFIMNLIINTIAHLG